MEDDEQLPRISPDRVAALGLVKDEDYCDGDPDDWVYRDADIFVFMTATDQTAVLHDVMALHKDKRGARTGVGRAALERFRPHFARVVASGVGDPELLAGDGKPDYGSQPAFQFWRAMMREGLVDEVRMMLTDFRITNDMLDAPIDTGDGVVMPEAGAPTPR